MNREGKVFPLHISLLLRLVIFLLGLAGPVVTVVLYMSGDNWKTNPKVMIPISIGYGLSVIIAVCVHYWVKNLWRSILISTVVSVLLYGFSMTCFILHQADAETLMWLPVILLFIGINGLPMAFLVSGSTIVSIRFNLLFATPANRLQSDHAQA